MADRVCAGQLPAYSVAAKKVKDKFKGNKERLFLEEAGNCFYPYVKPLLLTSRRR